MKGLYRHILYNISCYGDDLGRGKTKTSKARHRRTLKKGVRRFLIKNEVEE